MKRKVDAHMIAVMGLLIALMVVLSQILGFETSYINTTADHGYAVWSVLDSSWLLISRYRRNGDFSKISLLFRLYHQCLRWWTDLWLLLLSERSHIKTSGDGRLVKYTFNNLDLNTDLVSYDAEYSFDKLGDLVGPLAKSSHHVPDTNCVDLHRRACGTIQTADPTVRLTSKKER